MERATISIMADPQASSDPAAASSPRKDKSNDNDLLLQSIKQLVSVANVGLASFEEASHETSSTFVSRLTGIARQARFYGARAMATYEHRGQYGPQIVAGESEKRRHRQNRCSSEMCFVSYSILS